MINRQTDSLNFFGILSAWPCQVAVTFPCMPAAVTEAKEEALDSPTAYTNVNCGKKVILLMLPGYQTPFCSQRPPKQFHGTRGANCTCQDVSSVGRCRVLVSFLIYPSRTLWFHFHSPFPERLHLLTLYRPLSRSKQLAQRVIKLRSGLTGSSVGRADSRCFVAVKSSFTHTQPHTHTHLVYFPMTT